MVEQLQEKEGGSLQLKWKWQEENDPREGTEREREKQGENIPREWRSKRSTEGKNPSD
jgi:hypothetical protein